MFRNGQKLVCINSDSGDGVWSDFDGPVVGEIYTFKRYARDNYGVEVIHLYEIARGPIAIAKWGPNTGYGAYRFRPVQEKKTDISIFKAMLNPVKGKKKRREKVDG